MIKLYHCNVHQCLQMSLWTWHLRLLDIEYQKTFTVSSFYCKWIYVPISSQFLAVLCFLWPLGCCQRLFWPTHWWPFPPHYHGWNEQLFCNVFINLWQLMSAADQTGKLFVGDAVLQVGTPHRDLFARRPVWVIDERGNLISAVWFWQWN